MTSKTYNDNRGLTAMSVDPSGTVTYNAYDGNGQVLASDATDGGVVKDGSTDPWSDTPILTNDIVLSQTEYTYDADGNVILTVTQDRLPGDNDSQTGALADANGDGGPAAQVLLRRFVLRYRRSSHGHRQRRHQQWRSLY